MREVGLENRPRQVWAQSLRQETALQDQYRRAIHVQASGVANVGLGRWDAARCLQEQIDASRGVEHTMRLAKSRAINARFDRRAVMKDLQGSELFGLPANARNRIITNTNGGEKESGNAEIRETRGTVTAIGGDDQNDDNQSREEALKKFGIDLSRVGKLTSARSDGRKQPFLIAKSETHSGDSIKAPGESLERASISAATNGGRDNHSIASDGGERRRVRKRNRGGMVQEEKVEGGVRTTSSAKRQQVLSMKLKVLEMLLSEESSLVPSEQAKEEDVDKKHNGEDQHNEPLTEVYESRMSAGLRATATVANSNSDVGPSNHNAITLPQSPGAGMTVAISNSSVLLETKAAGSLELESFSREVYEKRPFPPIKDEVSKAEKLSSNQSESPRKKLDLDPQNKGEKYMPDGDGVETKLENQTKQRPSTRALHNHRPCWWWMTLLPAEGVHGVCAPDTVVMGNMNSTAFGGNGDQSTENRRIIQPNSDVDLSMPTAPSSNSRDDVHSRKDGSHPVAADPGNSNRSIGTGIIWISSPSSPPRAARGACFKSSPSRRSNGGVLEDDGETQNRTPSAAANSPAAATSDQTFCGSGQGEAEFHVVFDKHQEPRPHPLDTATTREHSALPVSRLTKEIINGEDGLVRATRGICECSRRLAGGDNDSFVGGRNGNPQTKLPLAVLKVWGRVDDEDRTKKRRESGHGRRQLRVVSLWTENDVLDALRDMSKSKGYYGNSRHKAKNSRTDDHFTLRDRPTPAGDYDSCCVQSFVKSVAVGISNTPHLVAANKSAKARLGSDTKKMGGPLPLRGLRSSSTTDGVGTTSERAGGKIRIDVNRERKGIGMTGSTGVRASSDVVDVGSGAETGRRSGRKGGDVGVGSEGPVFYRTAWRRTGGRRVRVWKMASRYPYVSGVAAHLCPLTGAGQGSGYTSPFAITEVDENRADLAGTATSAIEHFAKVLRMSYDPTLQRVWADWAVDKVKGQWHLIEVHGVMTDADMKKAARATVAKGAKANPKPKVSFSNGCVIPPSLSSAGGEDMSPPERVSSARRMMQKMAREISARVGTDGRRQPNRPTTPSKVSDKTKKALIDGSKGGDGKTDDGRRGRRLTTQYWRCAGDFCETQACATHERSALLSSGNNGSEVEIDTAKNSTGDHMTTGVARNDDGGTADGDDEDIVGRRKHAMSVEVPRTVLFRLVLNARSTLLGWRASAADFALMERPVQLCSACYSVCYALERERIEMTRRLMVLEEEAGKAGKEKRKRKPPGWKSRVQHELEESLGADRLVVSTMMDKLQAAGNPWETETTTRKITTTTLRPTEATGTNDRKSRTRRIKAGSGDDDGNAEHLHPNEAVVKFALEPIINELDGSRGTRRSKTGRDCEAASIQAVVGDLANDRSLCDLGPVLRIGKLADESGGTHDNKYKHYVRARRKAKERARRGNRNKDNNSGGDDRSGDQYPVVLLPVPPTSNQKGRKKNGACIDRPDVDGKGGGGNNNSSAE